MGWYRWIFVPSHSTHIDWKINEHLIQPLLAGRFRFVDAQAFARMNFLNPGLENGTGKLVCRNKQSISLSVQFVVGYGQLEFGHVGGTGFACAVHRRFGNAAVRAGIDGRDGCRMVCGTCRLRVTMCATTVYKMALIYLVVLFPCPIAGAQAVCLWMPC